MITKRKARGCLNKSISLAGKLEKETGHLTRNTALIFVDFGFLVRNRRLAQAILKLGDQHAYEGRMLLRGMLEIEINCRWIHLRNRERRANRFVKYHALERLKYFKEFEDFYDDPVECRRIQKKLKSERRKVRHLFLNKNKKGNLVWDKSWSSSQSVQSRLREIQKSEKGSYDSFLYGFYRWSSSAIHGSIHSFSEVLEQNHKWQAKSQPEKNPFAQMIGAFAVLLSTIRFLAIDANVFNVIETELTKLETELDKMKK